jgi:hypothetical protein
MAEALAGEEEEGGSESGQGQGSGGRRKPRLKADQARSAMRCGPYLPEERQPARLRTGS